MNCQRLDFAAWDGWRDMQLRSRQHSMNEFTRDLMTIRSSSATAVQLPVKQCGFGIIVRPQQDDKKIW